MEQYIEIFIEESREHLQSLNETLLELENNPNDMELLNEVFRVAHTLKGMAATMGFQKMQSLTHSMENVLSEIRNGNIKVDADLLDVLFQCLDALESYVNAIAETGSEGDEVYSNIIDALKNVLNGNKSKDNTSVENKKDKSKQTAVNNDDIGYKRKHLEIPFNAYQKDTAIKAKEEGFNLYGITIYISPKCMLKAARAFVIFNTVEELGEVIKTQPDVQDIEDEKFEWDFSIYILSKEDKETIKKKLTSISEVDQVLVDEIVVKKEKTVDGHKDEQAKNDSSAQGNMSTKGKKAKIKTTKSVRVDIEKLDTLMNLVSELIIIKNGLENIEGLKMNNNFNESVEYLERITTNLHDAVMKVRMVPVEQVFNRFPRMIRDLSRKLNKEIELHMSGKETELDRTIIDEIGEPLVHLLRNAADHGLETPEERKKQGKPIKGNIYLRAYQDGNNVVIEVKDDGKGINIEKIKNKAINNGLLTADILNNMSKTDIMELLFKPSFSMAEKITDVSGRGVGLDVVKTKIQAIGGNIETKSKLNHGSTFTIRLPLTLAIIQALMVNLGEEKYAIPLNTIQTIEDINVKDIKLIQNNEVIVLRDKVIPIIRLDKILDVKKEEKPKEMLTVVIVKKGEKLAGFVVDSLIGQQEIVIKSLGKYLKNIKMVAGATILGDGEVALILDINSLI